MAFVIKTAKTLRNHWKKSVFAATLVTYGIHRTNKYIEIQDLMRAYCERAAKYGHESISLSSSPRVVTVILNPNANKRKAAEDFEKYCAPLLHLAGISVELIKTESEGHAKTLVENINGTDAIVIAGGDGTLSEVVTGLLRRTNENASNLVPIGILPLGKTNAVAKTSFATNNKHEKVASLADATMAVIEQVTKNADVMKIEPLNADTESQNKPVYAVASLKWGAYRDAEVKKDKYWYFGSLRKYATYIFNGYKDSISWNCDAILNYNSPCLGCSNCHKVPAKQETKKGWFRRFIKEDNPHSKYLAIDNPECQKTYSKKISTTDLSLLTSNVVSSSLNQGKSPRLRIQIGPDNVEYLDFVKNGWRTEKGESRDTKEVLEVRTVEISPNNNAKDSWFSIDNEDYEVKAIKVTLLPNLLKMFCKKETT